MNRVVVTGLGFISSIGNNRAAVLDSLREGRSGIEFMPELAAANDRGDPLSFSATFCRLG